MTDTPMTKENIKDIRDTIDNHIAEPDERWLYTLDQPQWEYVLALLDQQAEKPAPQVASPDGASDEERVRHFDIMSNAQHPTLARASSTRADISEQCPICVSIRSLISAPRKVSRKEIKEWARTMTDVGDYYKNLTSDQLYAASEANENYLMDKLRSLGLSVEEAKPSTSDGRG